MAKTKLTGATYPHTNKLTLEQWKAFRGNFKSDLACKRYMIKATHYSFDHFIDDAFIWSETNEGSEYWMSIWGNAALRF